MCVGEDLYWQCLLSYPFVKYCIIKYCLNFKKLKCCLWPRATFSTAGQSIPPYYDAWLACNIEMSYIKVYMSSWFKRL